MSITSPLIKSIVGAGLLALPLVLGAGTAHAYGEASINSVQARESAAIEQGRYNGSLTRREYRDLKAEQRAIADMEARAKADGHITKREYRNIHEAQTNAAQHIREDRTNGKNSWYRRWLYNHR